MTPKRLLLSGALALASCTYVENVYQPADADAEGLDASREDAATASPSDTEDASARGADAGAESSNLGEASVGEPADASSMDASETSADAAQGLDSALDAHATTPADGGPEAARESDAGSAVPDAGSDAALHDAASTADGEAQDAGIEFAWPPGCTVYRVVSTYRVPANNEVHPQVYFHAPWGSERAQALAFRSVVQSSPAMHDMTLYSQTTGALLAHSDDKPIQTPPLPGDMGFYLPSGSSSLRLSLHYDNHGGAAHDNTSGFEICVVTGSGLRPTTAGRAMVIEFLSAVIPPRAEDHPVTSRCTLDSTQPIQLLGVQPFILHRTNSVRFTLNRAGTEQTVLHEEPYSTTKVWPIVPSATVQKGDSMAGTCRYTNPTDKRFSFGENTDSVMCAFFVTYAPYGAFRCASDADAGGFIAGGFSASADGVGAGAMP